MPTRRLPGKYDWSALKAEWIISNSESFTKYFKAKGIKKCTWEKHTKGWNAERLKHRHEIAEASLKRDIEVKIITVQQQQESMSNVYRGVLNLWTRLYKQIEAHDKARGELGPMSQTQYNQTVNDLAMITRLTPELIRANELLAGRPTDREDAADADKMLAKRAQEMQGSFEKWRQRLAKEVEVGGYDIGRVDEVPVERPAEAP